MLFTDNIGPDQPVHLDNAGPDQPVHVDNAGPGQPAHKCRMISAFIVRLQNQWIL